MSKSEKLVLENLKSLFPMEDIIYLYNEDPRYPFECDFYIKSKDLFIEVQGNWTHGDHPFDPTNEEDLKLVRKWEEKSQTSTYYKNAIKVWTISDPLKTKTAKENNLNYITIYNDELKALQKQGETWLLEKLKLNQ